MFPGHYCLPDTTGVCLFTTISKQVMDFQIQRDHYHDVYHLLLWLLPMGGACCHAITHCLRQVSVSQVPLKVDSRGGHHCTKLLGLRDCTRRRSALEVHALMVRWYGSKFGYVYTPQRFCGYAFLRLHKFLSLFD